MHKERLKQMRASVDVLTLSATPIPRTLHMSLMGVRDLSLIQTAPSNRMSIKTVVVPAADAIVQRAITSELDRGGQVYYVHNRIESIYGVARALEQLVPKARIAVGHGQMTESRTRADHDRRSSKAKSTCSSSTTIIENGIDIPNVNTIIVNDADKFGLAQLYQLRGRVGRSNHQAYAYLLYQAHKALSEDAKARLEAIREFTHLGSGLAESRCAISRFAARAICSAPRNRASSAPSASRRTAQLLAEAIAERKGAQAQIASGARSRHRRQARRLRSERLHPASLAEDRRLSATRRARAAQAEVDEIVAGVRDRFGPLPQAARESRRDHAACARSRCASGVTRVVIDETRLTLGVGSGFAHRSRRDSRKLQSLTKNKFRFAEGKILVDLPDRSAAEQLPILRALLEALQAR